MDKNHIAKLLVSVFLSVVLLCTATNAVANEQKAEKKKNEELMERIDFGNSYILGQSIKSGAVYLLHRKKSDIKSMLKYREDYRKEILEDFHVEDKS